MAEYGQKSAIISVLRARDREDWMRLWREYLDFYKTDLPEEMRETAWERLLSNDPHEFNGLLARDSNGAALGLAHFLFHRHGWKIEPVCYLQDLYVAPEARGRGVGRSLMREVYAAADVAGAAGVYWLTHLENTPARALYDSVGADTGFVKYQR